MTPIQYIGGSQNNDYMLTSLGNELYTQTVNENGTIQPVTMSSSIALSENTTPQVLADSDGQHPYKVPEIQNGQTVLVPYEVNGTPVEADNMPKFLVGWRAYNQPNHQFEDFQDTTLTQSVMTKYAVNGEIELYGKWTDISLIRVILYIPYTSLSDDINSRYEVVLTASSSYTPTHLPYIQMTENYKDIVDYGSPSVKLAKEFYDMHEYGHGSGCPYIVGTTVYPKYFGTKKNDYCNILLRLESGGFIPDYEFSNGSPVYHYYATPALRCYVNGIEKNSTRYDFSQSSPYTDGNGRLCWESGSTFTTGNGDYTVMIPLKRKPLVEVFVYPQNEGYAYIGTGSPTPQAQIHSATVMPGENCTVSTYTNNRETVFNGWFLGGPSGTLLSHSQTYTHRVEYPVRLYACYTPATPQVHQNPIVYLSYFIFDPTNTDTALASTDPVLPKYMTNGTTWITLNNTNELNFSVTTNQEVKLKAPLTGHGNTTQQTYEFRGFAQYYDTRNPSEDFVFRELLNGTFEEGGTYQTVGIGGTYPEMQLTISSLSMDTTYKVYACYVPTQIY